MRTEPRTGVLAVPEPKADTFEIRSGGIVYTFEAGTSRDEALSYIATHPAEVLREQDPNAPIGNRAQRRHQAADDRKAARRRPR